MQEHGDVNFGIDWNGPISEDDDNIIVDIVISLSEVDARKFWRGGQLLPSDKILYIQIVEML